MRILLLYLNYHSGGAEIAGNWPPASVAYLTGSPLARVACETVPSCDYYAATFERLFRNLVAPGATVVEIECQAAGAAVCRFSIGW